MWIVKLACGSWPRQPPVSTAGPAAVAALPGWAYALCCMQCLVLGVVCAIEYASQSARSDSGVGCVQPDSNFFPTAGQQEPTVAGLSGRADALLLVQCSMLLWLLLCAADAAARSARDSCVAQCLQLLLSVWACVARRSAPRYSMAGLSGRADVLLLVQCSMLLWLLLCAADAADRSTRDSCVAQCLQLLLSVWACVARRSALRACSSCSARWPAPPAAVLCDAKGAERNMGTAFDRGPPDQRRLSLSPAAA